MDFSIPKIIEYFTDPRNKPLHKIIVVLSGLIIIALIDNSLSFSTSYTNIKKYEQIQAINTILSDTTLSKSEKVILKQKRSYTLNYKTWKDRTYEFFHSIDYKFSIPSYKVSDSNNVPLGNPTHPNKTQPEIKKPDIKQETDTIKERSYWVHFVTSSWTIILCMIVLPVIIFFTEKENLIGAILGIPFFELFLFMISWVFAKVFSFIPIIMNNVNYNYVLNFVIHAAIIFILGFISKRNQKKKKAAKDKLFS